MPQTLLRLNELHKSAVIEMGMRGPGQIAYLAEIAEPTIGIVTGIGESHIELLGSREAIADAKGELLAALCEDGVAVIPREDDFRDRLSSKTKARRVFFGGPGSPPLVLNSPALHDVTNAQGALAVAVAANVSPEAAMAALAGDAPSGMRMEIVKTASGATVLSDCYNAAPTSVKSALETLANFPASGRKIAFLGDMKELGDFSESMHREVADKARALGLSEVCVVGPAMRQAFGGAATGFATSEEAGEFAHANLRLSANDVVLVKGSRAMTMERVVEALIQ